jgi:hypothetical protein
LISQGLKISARSLEGIIPMLKSGGFSKAAGFQAVLPALEKGAELWSNAGNTRIMIEAKLFTLNLKAEFYVNPTHWRPIDSGTQ